MLTVHADPMKWFKDVVLLAEVVVVPQHTVHIYMMVARVVITTIIMQMDVMEHTQL
jgi:hypothetical protein